MKTMFDTYRGFPKELLKNNLKEKYKINFQVMESLIKTKKDRDRKTRTLSSLFFAVGLVVSLLIVITGFEWKFYDRPVVVDLGKVASDRFENIIDIPPTEQPPPPPPKVQTVNIIEVSDEREIIEEIVDLDIEVSEETVVEDVVYEMEEVEFEEEKAEEIFTVVEERPEPVGGMAAFYLHVKDKMKYPTVAKRTGIQGKVFVQFVVEKDGSLTNVKILKGIGGGCDKEAIRVVQSAPKWNPGKQRGKPVRVFIVLPLHFILRNAPS